MSGKEDGQEHNDAIELTTVTRTDKATEDGSFAAQQQRAKALFGSGSTQVDGEASQQAITGPTQADEGAPANNTSAAEAQAELSRLLAEASSRRNTAAAAAAANTTAATATGTNDGSDGQNDYEAFSVRTNMLRNYWDGYHALSKFRRWILVLRLLIALAQIVSGIVVLALPTSLGDSFSFPETCDPEGMFVYLVLHISRVACSVPIDLYLGLSPHRSPRARRRGAEGLVERERNRRVGSLRLDRKLGRLGDLLGFCHVVLFIVGNYVVWTSVECSHAPADSKPLFFTCVAMLSISYLIILEVALMVFLVIFFLPLLIALLNALGLSHRLPQRDIHPETGKITQQDIEKYSRIVYFTPLLEDLVEGRKAATNRQSKGETSGAVEQANSEVPALDSGSGEEASNASSGGILSRLSLKPRKDGKSAEGASDSNAAESRDDKGENYPLFPIPAHRATCPICLADYEDGADGDAQERAQADQQQQSTSKTKSEPLRLLRCGHVMHKACVDQWLTAVSGRCPVCQKPVIGSDKEDREQQ